jgi:predicted N-acetyltransferase YhbS
VITREYTDGDEEAIVELLETVFAGWPKYDIDFDPVDFWRWKYHEGIIPETIYVIEDEDKIVASYHTWRQKVKVNHESHVILEGMDYTVHPDYRGRGLSRKVADLSRQAAKKKGIPAIYVITENPIILRRHKKETQVKGFPRKLVNMTRIKDISKQLREIPVKNQWIINLGYRTLSAINSIANTFRQKPVNEDINIDQVEFFPEQINNYWESIKDEYSFSVELTEDYLNWRYCDPRSGGYQVFLAREKDQIIGYIVLRTNKTENDYTIGYIVELSYPPGRLDAGYKLLEKGLSVFEKVNTVNYLTVAGHPDTRLLQMFGFLDSKIQLHVNYEVYSKKDPFKSLSSVPPERIHISWGNFDILPTRMPKN